MLNFNIPDNGWGIAIFATTKSLINLAEAETVYMDGTFFTAPKPYYQFFTIHGRVNRRVLPLVCALMTDNTTGAYRKVSKKHSNSLPQKVVIQLFLLRNTFS